MAGAGKHHQAIIWDLLFHDLRVTDGSSSVLVSPNEERVLPDLWQEIRKVLIHRHDKAFAHHGRGSAIVRGALAITPIIDELRKERIDDLHV